jgi:hypothetical protein
MITFNRLGLYGLFGNQMFQYATLYAIAKTRGYEFGVPYSNTGDIKIHQILYHLIEPWNKVLNIMQEFLV